MEIEGIEADDLPRVEWLDGSQIGDADGNVTCDGCSETFEVPVGVSSAEQPIYYAYVAGPGDNREQTDIRYVYCEECGEDEGEIRNPTKSFTELIAVGRLIRQDETRTPQFSEARILTEEGYGSGSQ